VGSVADTRSARYSNRPAPIRAATDMIAQGAAAGERSLTRMRRFTAITASGKATRGLWQRRLASTGGPLHRNTANFARGESWRSRRQPGSTTRFMLAEWNFLNRSVI
jgi:hypothetical protein